MTRYSHDSWSVDLPNSWQVEEETELVAFFHPDGVGKFEVSTFFADEGDISNEEILEFAEVETAEVVELPYLSGIYLQEEEDGETIFQWWLSSANQLIYATYICNVGDEETEKSEREQLITSLRSLLAS